MLSSDDLAFFRVVASSASLAEAARNLNVTPPAITQRLRSLELRVGVRLMDRTARGLHLTDEGELIATQGTAILDAIEELTETLASRTSSVRGKLRIAAPYGFGRQYVAPVVRDFGLKHPQATITLELSNNPAMLSSDSWDVVIHIGSLGSMGRIVTTLASNRRIICAAPDYLLDRPAIQVPDDLLSHRCLALRENNEDVTLWRFRHKRSGEATVRVTPAMSSNDGSIMREWALAGLGIMVRSEWDVADDLAAGRLIRILPDWEPPAADVVALLNARHGRSRRATAFLDMMRAALIPPPWRQDRTSSVMHPG
jgi:DNA-binding transcriptional LysR family regulator